MIPAIQTPKFRMSGTRWFAVFTIGVCVLAYWQTFEFAEGTFSLDLSETGTYPRIILAATGCLALWLLFHGEGRTDRTEDSSEGDTEQTHQSWTDLVTPLAILAFFAIYIFLIDVVGFLISSFLFSLACQLILIKPISLKRIGYSVAVSAVLVLFVFIIFDGLLNIILP